MPTVPDEHTSTPSLACFFPSQQQTCAYTMSSGSLALIVRRSFVNSASVVLEQTQDWRKVPT